MRQEVRRNEEWTEQGKQMRQMEGEWKKHLFNLCEHIFLNVIPSTDNEALGSIRISSGKVMQYYTTSLITNHKLSQRWRTDPDVTLYICI